MDIFDNYFGRKVSRKLHWIAHGCEREPPAPGAAGKNGQFGAEQLSHLVADRLRGQLVSDETDQGTPCLPKPN